MVAFGRFQVDAASLVDVASLVDAELSLPGNLDP